MIVKIFGSCRYRVILSLLGGPKTAREMSKELGIDIDYVYKLLRKLRAERIVYVGYYRESERRPARVWALNRDHPWVMKIRKVISSVDSKSTK